MQLQVDIDEADVGSVVQGDTASFTVEAYPGKTFPAAISQIRYSPETVEGVVTYKAILTVDNTDLLAAARHDRDRRYHRRSGQGHAARSQRRAALHAAGGRDRLAPAQRRPARSADAVPARRRERDGSSDRPPTGRRTLYVLRDGAPVAVPVKVGATDGTNTAVTSADLKDGDKAITGSRTAG